MIAIGVVGEDWINVKAGSTFAIAQHDKVVWAWGSNTIGQLVNNTTTAT